MKQEIKPKEIDAISANLFAQWAKEDKSFDVDNIAHPEKLKPYNPKA